MDDFLILDGSLFVFGFLSGNGSLPMFVFIPTSGPLFTSPFRGDGLNILPDTARERGDLPLFAMRHKGL